MAERLMGYVAHDGDPDDFAILVFARSEDEALGLARPVIHSLVGGFLDDEWTVAVEPAATADPEVWGVTEPCALEPSACEVCERWYASGPVGDDDLCDSCREDERGTHG